MVRNSSFLSRDRDARRPAQVPPRNSSIPSATPTNPALPPANETRSSPPRSSNSVTSPPTKSPPPESTEIKSPPVNSPPVKCPPVKTPANSPPVKSPPVKSPRVKSPVNSPGITSPPVETATPENRTPPVSTVVSSPPKRVIYPRNEVTSPTTDSRSAGSNARNDDAASVTRTPWRASPVTKEGPARAEKLSLAANLNDRAMQSTVEPVTVNSQKVNSNGVEKSEEESIGVGDRIKKFEKAAEDASASAGRSRPGSVRGRPRTERLGSDNSREDLPPPATPFKDNVHFDLGAGTSTERPATVLERQQSLTRNAAGNSVVARWQRTDSTTANGEKIRPEPQKIIKPEFKPMPSPVEVTIRSPSLGVKIGDQFPSHGTAFRNVASPDPSRSREPHRCHDDATAPGNFKTCKSKNKEKYSVSKGSSYFTRGSEEIWLVKKKDIEEIEERVLDSFRRAGGNVCMRSESMRPASDQGAARGRRAVYARSESLEPAGPARASTLRRQASACTCAHDKRPRSRSHGDDAQPHVLDKYETLV